MEYKDMKLCVRVRVRVRVCVCVNFKLILKWVWKFQGPKMVKTTLEEKDKVGRFILPDAKTYYNTLI